MTKNTNTDHSIVILFSVKQKAGSPTYSCLSHFSNDSNSMFLHLFLLLFLFHSIIAIFYSFTKMTNFTACSHPPDYFSSIDWCLSRSSGSTRLDTPFLPSPTPPLYSDFFFFLFFLSFLPQAQIRLLFLFSLPSVFSCWRTDSLLKSRTKHVQKRSDDITVLCMPNIWIECYDWLQFTCNEIFCIQTNDW